MPGKGRGKGLKTVSKKESATKAKGAPKVKPKAKRNVQKTKTQRKEGEEPYACAFTGQWDDETGCPLCSDNCRACPKTKNGGIVHCRRGTCLCASLTGWGGSQLGSGNLCGNARQDMVSRQGRRVNSVKQAIARTQVRATFLQLTATQIKEVSSTSGHS